MIAVATPTAILEARIAELELQLHKAVQREVHYRHLAHHDDLTGLLNRAGLADAWPTLPRTYRLALLDVDHFKAINDTHGHAAGDTVLTHIAARMACYPVAARLGGDELVVVGRLADGPDRSWTVPLADGLRIRVTATAGIADVVPGGLAATLARADAAMYRAKRAGRGSVACYSPTLDDRPRAPRPRVRLRDASLDSPAGPASDTRRERASQVSGRPGASAGAAALGDTAAPAPTGAGAR